MEHFGRQPLRVVAGVEPLFADVAGERLGRALVGVRNEDRPHQGLEIELVVDDVLRGRSQQFFVAGRVGDPHVIDRHDEAHAEVVGPDAIGDRPREVRVVGRGHPLGQFQAAVGFVFKGDGVAVERRRRLRLAGPGLDEFTVGGDVQRPHAVAVSRFAAPALGFHAREQAGHAVVLVVGPFFERMVVTLRAADRESHERLAGVLGHVLGALLQGVEVGGAVLDAVAGRRQDLADRFIPGGVLFDPLPQPVVIRLHGRRPQPCAVDRQDVRPLVGPVVDVFLPGQKGVGQLLPLIGRGVVEERLGIFLRRQRADRVEVGPAYERAVIADWRGRQVQADELFVDEFIDEVLRRNRRAGDEVTGRIRDRQISDRDLLRVPGADRPFARAHDAREAMVIHPGDGVVRRRPFDPRRNVADFTIREVREDEHLLRCADGLPRLGRQDFQMVDLGIIVRRSGRAAGDPLGDDLVVGGIDFEPDAPFVGQCAGWLGENQAAAGIGQFHPPATILLRHREVVGRRVVPAERQPEAAFTGECSVAGAHVAAGFGQDGQDIVAEGPGVRLAEIGDDDFGRGLLPGSFGDDDGLAVPARRDDAILNVGDRGITGRPGDVVHPLARDFVTGQALQYNPADVHRAAQLELSRKKHQRFVGGERRGREGAEDDAQKECEARQHRGNLWQTRGGAARTNGRRATMSRTTGGGRPRISHSRGAAKSVSGQRSRGAIVGRYAGWTGDGQDGLLTDAT